MAKQKMNTMWIIGIIIIAIFVFKGGIGGTTFSGAMVGSETLERTFIGVSNNRVDAGNTFQVCYTVVGATGQWAIPYVDVISGGCTLNSGATQVTDVMLSDSPDTPGPRCATVRTPSSAATCTFHGDYDLAGVQNNKLITPDRSITISVCTPSCSCAANTCVGQICPDGCGGNCAGTKSPVCTRPSNLCIEAITQQNGCGGNCAGSWTVTKKTAADADCNNIISRPELSTAISQWIAGSFPRADLSIAILSWIGGA